MKNIMLELHKQNEYEYTLDFNDAFGYLSENVEKELELILYIEKWCNFLNWHIYHNEDMILRDAEKAQLQGWIAGYNCARKIEEKWLNDRVVLKMRGYTITLIKPYNNK